MSGHDWALIAPWWNWPRPGVPERGRGSGPVIQKYDTPKLVDAFLADPQHRLKFLEQVDRVVEYTGDVQGTGTVAAHPTGRRKLFQPNHFRHYLVVCSLHCQAPGLPPVDRSQVCQAGFVIRKRDVKAPAADGPTARSLVAAVNIARRKLATIDGHISAARHAPNIPGVRLAALALQRESTLTLVEQGQRNLRTWAASAGLTRSLRGWVPTGNEGEGNWTPVPELPDELTEHFYPLYPLIAPGNTPDHDAAGQTISFGLVPTVSAEHDTSPCRSPRFDDTSAYEIRCFVRRHAPNCPTKPGAPNPAQADCRGQLVWSEPSQVFSLAAHFDLRGTANRPINVRMPDLRSLKAQAGSSPVGVQFTTPPRSEVTGDGPTGAGFQICSFSIPLITIIAMFVLQLFLPIVVLLFQLWFMLLLKFCIPPEIDVAGGLQLALDFEPPRIEVDADLGLSFDAATGGANVDSVLGLFGPAVKMAKDHDAGYQDALKGIPRLSRRSLLRQVTGQDAMGGLESDLVYEPRVARSEVVPA